MCKHIKHIIFIFFAVSVITLSSKAVLCAYGYFGSQDPGFWTIFNNLVLLATFIVIGYYTYETVQLRKATVEGNVLSFRPVLIFDAGMPFCTVKNRGTGPALNACLIVWSGSTIKVPTQVDIPGIMTTGDVWRFSKLEDIDSAKLKSRLPEFSTTIDRILKTKHPLVCVLYTDLAGNRFFSTINGTNEKYDGVFEHGPAV